MNELEKFLAQIKEKHLRSIGLTLNDDEEHNALCLKREQLYKKRKEIYRKYNELAEIFLEVQTKESLLNQNEKDILFKYISNLIYIDKPNHFLIEEKHIDIIRITKETPSQEMKELKKEENKKIQEQFFSIIKEGYQIQQKAIENGKEIDDGLKLINCTEKDMLLIKIANFFKDYKTPDWKQHHEIELEIVKLNQEIRKYSFKNEHWFKQGNQKKVIDISDEEYDKLCKIYPPFLLKIEEYIKDVYEKGKTEGYSLGENNGYNEGYNRGYDDGYEKGYADGC